MWKCCSCFSKTYEAPEVLELDYRHSSLTEVPADVFGFERTLEKLDLGSNQISDLPPSLFHCHELKELDLCDNDLMTIPPAIGSLTRLSKLDLSRNGITDIADGIKNCKSLVHLDLSMNHLTKLPEGISQLVNLEELFLNDTYLEFLHANFGRLTKLKILELRENSLQSLPKSMSRLHHLQRLDIGQNDISELPEVIGTMTNLSELWCDNNSLHLIPKFIGNLPKLNCLDLSQNEIQEVSDEISKCTQIDDLTLNSNMIEQLPDCFVRLESLSVLRLDKNSLQYLPDDFGNLKNLQELSVVSNSLKKLPPSIGLLRKLHTVYLDDNFLSELPKEIGSCYSLSVLSVAKNQLKEIPSEIGHLSSLKVITLSGNLIVHLPVSILSIQKLCALWLSESQSKPLLQLNKEIDPASGQHVLTCYLLPQLPANEENQIPQQEMDDTVVTRRSRPHIKFMTDVEPVIVDNNVSKRGLLRAPTPYPKELRALAKHASQIRQSKDINGELINTNEPEYEGDIIVEDDENRLGREEVSKNRLVSTKSSSVHNTSKAFTGTMVPPCSSAAISKSLSIEVPKASTNQSTSSFINKQEDLKLSVLTRDNQKIGLPSSLSINRPGGDGDMPHEIITAKPTDFHGHLPSSDTTKASSYSAANNLETSMRLNQQPEPIISDNASAQGTRFSGLPDLPDKSCRESYGSSSSELARKSPPPYHVAARRAAFFRSSGGAGGVKITGDMKDLQQPLISQLPPLGGVRMFPSASDSPSVARPDLPTVGKSTSEHIVMPHAQTAPSTSSPPDMNSTFTKNDVYEPDGQNIRWGEAKGESDQLLANEHFQHVEEDGNSDVQDSSESKLNRTYVVSADVDSVSDIISSSVEENTDELDEAEKGLDENILDESEVEQRSRSFVETIETALESVDKRTTEFLRNDKWEPEINSETANQSSKIFSSETAPSDHSEHSNLKPRVTGNVKKSGILPPSFSLKGPVPPPKPSPLLSRNINPGVNLASDTYNTSYAGLSKVESYTKIPLFSNTSNLNKPSNNEVAATMLSSSQTSRIVPVSSTIHTTIPVHRNYEIATSTPVVSSSSTASASGGGTATATGVSRIPSKLPSLSSMTSSTSLQSSSKHGDVLSPQPSTEHVTAKSGTVTRAITPSRIPSFGSGDGSSPHNIRAAAPMPMVSPTTSGQYGAQKYPSNVSHAANSNANPNSSRIGSYGAAKVSQTNVANPLIPANSSVTNVSTKIPKFGETPGEKQELKRSASGTKIPKFNEPSNSNLKPVSPVPASIGSSNETNSADNSVIVSENNNDSFSSLSNIPIPGGGSNSSSKIPALANRKPWIFGTHKNARVVPVEFRKVNDLGFVISDGTGAGHTSDAHGIYIVSTDDHDSTVKIGDKILQIDGIDVSNMGVEIVRKILGNCQENINLLVSRQS